jgi:hypothetical protein
MFVDDEPELVDIENRLREAVRLDGSPDDDNIELVLRAHMNMLVRYLALTCSSCRVRIWKELKRVFPNTIGYALDLAATTLKDHPGRHRH